MSDSIPSIAWLEVEGETIHLNQSRIHFYLNCHRRYWWMFEECLIPDRPIWPLKDGKAVHAGLEALHKGHNIDESVKAAEAEFDSGWEGVVTFGAEEEIAENREMVSNLTRAYIEYYGTEEDWKVLAPECEGRVEVGEGTNCFLVFRTDAIISMMQRLFILENKTAKQLGKILNGEASTLRKYQIALQLSAYVYGVRKLTGQNIAGVLMNMLIKTKTPKFHREIFMRTDEELKRFEIEFVELCKEIAWRRKRVAKGEDAKTVFYRNTDDCYRFGTCPYIPLCLKDTPHTRLSYVQKPIDYVETWAAEQVTMIEPKGGEK